MQRQPTLAQTDSLEAVAAEVIRCRACPRLTSYCRQVAAAKRKAYLDWEYWGKPAPGFGDPEAALLIVGLAPAAHGANRTGRLFTGDRSGDFLFRALYETGFATQPHSTHRDDGMRLRNAYITAAVRCAPPQNKPTPEEFANCRPFLVRELDLLGRLRAVVALGKVAFDTYLRILRDRGVLHSLSPFRFAHGARYTLPSHQPTLIASYHPSQQNTLTKRLTYSMFREIFEQAKREIERP